MKRKLLLLFMGISLLLTQAFAQQVTVTGKVTSSDGLPVPGASVKIKGSQSGVQAGASGTYSISAKQGDVLVFSFIGTVTQEKTVTGNVINVVLPEDNTALNEVVVTAYGIDRDKKSLGYSTPTVNGDEVSQTQRNDFFGGLQGRVPGLSINSTNGNPGASAQIVLRGFVSISGDNNALIVVDGVPIDNSTLNETRELVTGAANRDQDYSNRGMDINPNDIESYVIMKGPEATALYGNAGASGAILITTKKGKAGKGSINYNNSFRVERLNKFPEIQRVYNSGVSNGIYSGTTSNFFGPKFSPETKLYDNISEFFQTGFSQKHNLSFEGGTDQFSYRWSNEYTDTKGTIPTSTFERFSSRLTAVGTISPILKLTGSFTYINSDNDKVNKGPNGTLLELMRYSSAFDVRDYQDANGNRVLHLASIYAEFDNPLWDVYKNISNDKVNRFMANTSFELKPAKWLKVNGTIGADVSTTDGIQVYHPQSYRGSGSATSPTGGRVVSYDKLIKMMNGTLTAVARHEFGDFNNTYILGASVSDYNSSTDSQQGTNMFDPDFYNINNTLPTTQRTRNYINRYRNVGVFAQAVLGYKSLLYLTLTGRVDGASRLMPNSPYFAYPSVSMAFNFTDLNEFKENISWLSYGKLRASYAFTGKEPWREYSTGSNYEAKRYSGGGFAYSYYGGNPDLKPERSENFEIGTELQFLNRRIGVDFNYYNLLSKDQIINPRLSYGTGFVLKMLNGGTVRNRGVEVQLTGSPLKRKNLSWDVVANFTRNRGTVVSLANDLPELYESDTWVIGSVRTAVHPGYSTLAISGTKFPRNDRGDLLINPSSGLPATSSDTRYYPIGDRAPNFTLGLVNSFKFKNLSFSFLWDLRYGGDVVNGTEYDAYRKGISVKTLDRELPRVVVGVLADGLENSANPTKNAIAVTPYTASAYYSTNVSPEMFIEKDINTLRLRDVTLAYDFPAALAKKTGFLQSLGVFVTVTDAILITNYSGGDPESNSNTPGVGGVGGFGIDYGNVGKPIGFNLGLRMKL